MATEPTTSSAELERLQARVEALEREAAERGVSMGALALAWLLALPEITAVVVGPGRLAHLDVPLEALEVDVDDAGRDRLTALFAPCAS